MGLHGGVVMMIDGDVGLHGGVVMMIDGDQVQI